MKIIPLVLTYDDVLIIPRRSSLLTRKQADTKTNVTKKLSIHIPIVSANMDTVTESTMAMAMARWGGVGIIHRFMTIEDNVEEIKRVKRAQNLIIRDPYTIDAKKTVGEAKRFIAETGVSGLLVTSSVGKLLGVLSQRDLLFSQTEDTKVEEIMTIRKKIVVSGEQTTFEEARKLMAKYKVEKLPLVNEKNKVVGLITIADVKNLFEYPNASLDKKGRLIVGGAVGVHGDYIERAQELKKAGADFLVIDIAHGHSDMMFNAIKNLRKECSEIELMAGNIATGVAAKELCEAGVDSLKVGVGPGTTCITRLVTGCGVPQLTAVLEVAEVAKKYGVPVCADGGIQRSGDIVKAIGAGADTVMCGGLFAGTEEAPGVTMSRGGKKYKVCRGSASFGVSQRRKQIKLENKELKEVVPEGVESIVPYKGSITELIGQLVGGLKSGMSYTNAHTINELQKNVEFVQITSAGSRESGPHDLEDVKI